MALETAQRTQPDVPDHYQDVEEFPPALGEILMSTTGEEDIVWIGFMDIVPVIGTIKEAVELVLALYEGNEGVVKEKEKAIENILKEPLKKHKSTDKPAAERPQDVIAVRKEMIFEYVTKVSKGGTKPQTSTQQKEKEKRVEAIIKEALEKIRIIDPTFKGDLEEELKKVEKRSKRGEHVFNNDILKFHFKVLTDFIRSHKMYNLRGYNQQAMDTLGKHTLSRNTAEDIQTNMVVHFGEDEFYLNMNAVMYGKYCRALHDALLDVLRCINPDDMTKEKRERVNDVIDNMNNLQIYVDHLAKEKWIGNRETRRTRVEKVRQEVAKMYNTDRGLDWCRRILEEVAPLFGNRQ